MNKPPYKKGNWQVTRFCCSSGLCIECHARGNHGNIDRRARVVQTDHVSKAWARYVEQGWALYGAKAEVMS